MKTPALPDQAAREQALDCEHSYIVQAPAGSGKTELLTQRYLKLLARCRSPEELLAITFTRKAAAEMADRIMQALQEAAALQQSGKPQFDSPLVQQRFTLASAVLATDASHHWQLLGNPSRLRIQTIDSFCLSLGRRLPLLSTLGGDPVISEDVSACFALAIHNTLALLESDAAVANDIARLLQHLDNDFGRVETLLTSLLKRRDQWLPYILNMAGNESSLRAYLQETLEQLISESLEVVAADLQPVEAELVTLVSFAAGNLSAADTAPELDALQSLQVLPTPHKEHLDSWCFIAELLLTKTGSWRKQVNVKNGFPAGDKQDKAFDKLCKERKQQMQTLLEAMAAQEDLREALAYIRLLPHAGYGDQHWEFILALCSVLTQLSAELLLAFRQTGQVDYVQLGAAARNALGSEDAPTDLALALDYRLQHILVDEFQDTSQLQLELLSLLTAGWQPEDGRTLFLVGDPMQSVYQFRNANVGIFLAVQQGSLGQVPVQPLTLSSNFRSQANVVNWVNSIFQTAFPLRTDPSRGAVPYSPSSSCVKTDPGDGVRTRCILYNDEQKAPARQREAELVVAEIQELRARHPAHSIAVLVRNRSHLRALLPALREAGLLWQSTDIDTLASIPAIEDLLSLMRAVLNPADRLAWLSLLRAPWCGLRAADLLCLSRAAEGHSLWWALNQSEVIERLSSDARQRTAHFTLVMGFGLQLKDRVALRLLLENLWTLLRGNDSLRDPAEADSIAACFDLIGKHDAAGGLENLEEFAAKVLSTYVPSRRESRSSPELVHILTMHKAKGLEFDHIILPGLANLPRQDDKDLLLWHERLNQQRESRLLMAALSATGSDDDPLYKLLRYEQQRKTSLENTRLLYIAVTRARYSALLLATLKVSPDGEMRQPPERSLLHSIWNELNMQTDALDFDSIAEQTAPSSGTPVWPRPTPLRRFAEPLQVTESQLARLQANAGDDRQSSKHFESLATLSGSLLHRALRACVLVGKDLLQAPRREGLEALWRRELQTVTDDSEALESCLQGMLQALEQSVSHDDYAWIFDAALEDSQCELAVEQKNSEGRRRYVLDRTFIDASGTRWIIDYKTTALDASQSAAEFIATQAPQHQAQLQQYAALFRKLEERPIKTAVFFTALPQLVELD